MSMIHHEVMNGVSFSVVVAKAGVVQSKSWELSTLCVPMSNDTSAGRQPECVAFGFPLLVQLKSLAISLCGEMVFVKDPELVFFVVTF